MPRNLAITLAVLLLIAFNADGESLSGRVIGVSDGDTVTILQIDGDRKTPRKIRISGIDAPEAKQPFGNRAKQAMSDLAYGKHADADCPTTDRYGRDVCKVTVDGVDVGLALIQQGYAWHFKKYQRTQTKPDRFIYAESEDRARAEQKGLWHDAHPVPPWEWRKASKAR
jgi:endonuclease YncB( thermonuclease family)